MKIALLGYGKMGQEIERLAEKRDHTIVLVLDSQEDWDEQGARLSEADVAIEFSTPDTAAGNILRCFEAGVPVVCGTTGWYDDFDRIRVECLSREQTLFFAPNFSIGVNLFFKLNRYLACMMSEWSGYEISIEETHHIHKQDAPSGTAIVLANDILRDIERKNRWVKEAGAHPEELGIKSFRTENVPGTHNVRYESEEDVIEIIHTAKSRKGFVMGAMLAAEWLPGRTGIFEMKDLLSAKKTHPGQ